jgi:hypothetical protein
MENLKDITDVPIKVSSTLEYKNTFSEDVQIDKTNLFEEFAEQSAKYAYYGSLCAIMSKKLREVQREIKELYAQLDAEYRRQAIDHMQSNAKLKYTETMYDNRVITTPKYIEKKKEENEIALIVDLLEIQKDAMKQRKDMLIQLGADNRQSTYDTRVTNEFYRDSKEKR